MVSIYHHPLVKKIVCQISKPDSILSEINHVRNVQKVRCVYHISGHCTVHYTNKLGQDLDTTIPPEPSKSSRDFEPTVYHKKTVDILSMCCTRYENSR